MKPDIRWQLLLALTGLAIVAGLLSFQVESAALCTTTVPASGGTYVEGVVGRPVAINPLLSDNYPVDDDLVSLVFDGLVSVAPDGNWAPALAESWTVSEDGLTVQFALRDDVLWHDGEPFMAADVAFTYGLLQDDAYPGPADVRALWQTVDIRVVDDHTIEFGLSQPYAPFIEATTRGILPAHLLEGIASSDLPALSFNKAPIGTGPFMVQAGQDWERSGDIRLTPNPNSWREGTQVADIQRIFFESAEQLLDAYQRGDVHAASDLPPALVADAALPGARLFTAAEPRYTSLLLNLSESGSGALDDPAVRKALAQATDRQALIDAVLQGQAIPVDGPYLPDSWAYRPGLNTVHSHDPVAAAAALDAAGWVLPAGGTTRQREAEPLELRLLASDTSEHRQLAEAIAQQWQQIGIHIVTELVPDGQSLQQALLERGFDVALADIAATVDPDLYDFWSQEAIVNGQNYGGWNHRRASEALEGGRQTYQQLDRAPFYEAFTRYYNEDLPAISLFQRVQSYFVSDEVERLEIGRIYSPRDRYRSLPDWFLSYREVTAVCPEPPATQ